MKNKTRIIKIVAALLYIGILTGGYAYREYHRKNINAADAKAGFSLTDEQLIKEYGQDQEASNKKYSGILLEISGTVKKVDTDAAGMRTIILGSEAR